MKAIFLAYNQAYHEEILAIMNNSGVKGYTYWDVVKGRGSFTGDPHLGDHAWPTLNSSMFIALEDKLLPGFKAKLKELDEKSSAMGLRFFSWTIDND